MKTQEQIEVQLRTIRQALHLQPADAESYLVGQMTALLWATGSFDSWGDASLEARRIWRGRGDRA